MYKEFKYSWDCMFVFMLVVSVIFFMLEFVMPEISEALHVFESIDFVILGGYYIFFGHDIYRAKHKLKYCRQHLLLMILLALPLLPLARILRFALAERVFWLAGDMLWHFLDEIELL